jgi:hypothetical protein
MARFVSLGFYSISALTTGTENHRPSLRLIGSLGNNGFPTCRCIALSLTVARTAKYLFSSASNFPSRSLA